MRREREERKKRGKREEIRRDMRKEVDIIMPKCHVNNGRQPIIPPKE